ncbi:MAG TPA: hypothetical protein VMH04_03670 [Candidatus Solibacter sp.]|nr:hypothetical protein [Candidatus Solibacter sp.]
MAKSNGRYQPSSIVVHNLINKLAVIVGRCELMMDEAKEDGGCTRRLEVIRDLAKAMAEELVLDQAEHSEVGRAAVLG